MAAAVAQRRAFAHARRLPPTAANALALLVLARATRLVMWALMCSAGEWEGALMLADAAHCALAGQFVRAYVRAARDGTSDLLLATRQLGPPGRRL